jgi:phosphatidate cytidylyltransferase
LGELKKRVTTGLLLAPIVVAFFYFLPPLWFFTFLAAVTSLALYEVTVMARAQGKYLIIILSLVSLLPLYFERFDAYILWLLVSPLIYLILRFIQGDGKQEGINEKIIKGIVIILLSEVFIIIPVFSIYMLKGLNNYLPLVLLLTVWASDIGAYMTGKTFGKRPLAPMMSPNKTVEGLLGAVSGSAIIIVLSHNLLGFSIIQSLLTGIALGILGQAGDLLESAGKRVSSAKDSSSLIPGHGGVLDRLDSFIFTAPLLYICLMWKA